MREHMGLFRGKHPNGMWVYGSLANFRNIRNELYTAIIPAEDGENQIRKMTRVDPDTLGECVSMCDKNGKLIFEGDIIEQVYLGVKHRFTIVYSQASFAWGQKNNNGLTGRLAKGIGTLEIIGNIYDNPELLEGAGDDAAD